MYRCCVLVLVACGSTAGPVESTDNQAPPQAPGAVTHTASPPPAGWVEVQPTEASLRCANHANDEWELSLADGRVVATPQTNREPSRGPTVPFALPQGAAAPGRKSVVAVDDGFLVGTDAGEWGGSLLWASQDGKQMTELGTENVAMLIDLGGVVLSLEGLAHLSLDEGKARWIAKQGGVWKAVAAATLDGAPQAMTRVGDATYVLTTKGLTRLDKTRRATVVRPLTLFGLYPDSGVADAAGTLWFGMRHYVVQLVPTGDTFTPHWFELSPACT